MKKKISGIISVALSIIILIFFESFIFRMINMIGINLSDYSNTINLVITIGIKLLMCIMVYILHKKEFKRRKNKNNIFKSLLLFGVCLIVLVLSMYIFDYIIKYIGDIFNIEVIEKDLYNIFDKTIDFNLIVKILLDYIITPYLYCSIILLSVDKLTKRNDTFIFMSGLLASIMYGLTINGTIGFIIINSLSMFLLFALLALIYKKNNSIYFTIIIYSFYLVFNSLLLEFIRW